MDRIAHNRGWMAAFLTAVLVLAGCMGDGTGHSGEIPSEAAARAYLNRLVATARTKDLEAFCDLAGSLCSDLAEAAGGVAAIPANPPLVAGTRLIPTRTSANGNAGIAGGRLFVLCGTDGLGRDYRTELLVSVDFNGRLYAINGVYWSGSGLAVSGNTGDATGGTGIECPPD